MCRCGYAYQPNKNILYPEDDHDEDNDNDDTNADKPDATTDPSGRHSHKSARGIRFMHYGADFREISQKMLYTLILELTSYIH